MLCIARSVLSQDVCSSVCPSHADIMSKRLNVHSNFLTWSIFSFFRTKRPYMVNNDVYKRYGGILTGTPLTGVDTSHSYCGMRIANRTQDFEWYGVPFTINRTLGHTWLTVGLPLYLVPFSSYLTLNNIVTLKYWSEVTHDHWKWYHSKVWIPYGFLFAFHSNCSLLSFLGKLI